MNWAARQDESWRKEAEDARTDGDMDYARIVHSASFRRLQGKTQVLSVGQSDFYRTRLTHSIEVAQIAVGLCIQFAKKYENEAVARHLPDRALIQAIGLTHDMGHPPFGHGGEIALNYCMRDHGGFEGNGQTLRILTKLEKFSPNNGANLSRRTLLGVLKYPIPYKDVSNPNIVPALRSDLSAIRILDREASKPPKCYLDCERDVVDWILRPLSDGDRSMFSRSADVSSPEKPKHRKPLHKSLDCSIMDTADDISFAVHDLEDALALMLISREQFEANVPESKTAGFLEYSNARNTDGVNDAYGSWVDKLFGEGDQRKRMISRMVSYLVQASVIEEDTAFEEPLLRYSAGLVSEARAFVDALKAANYEAVIRSPGVQQLEFKGQNLVVAVFEALQSEPNAFLPIDTRTRYEASDEKMRVLCDHVSGMTDDFLLKTYGRLFSPGSGSVFDKL
jgi:dGTPase